MIRYAGLVFLAVFLVLAGCGKKGDPVAPTPHQPDRQEATTGPNP
ncbi:hypothetical protein [Oceanicella sp. SM1341]|nr:hypothetical protein [Oceanicella sp. SM1341]